MDIITSTLNKTFFIDVDGTIFEHNTNNILPGVLEFFNKIDKNDKIIITTSRKSYNQDNLIDALKQYNLRYDKIIFDLPLGERIVINDIKPETNLNTAIAININRNVGLESINITRDDI